MSTDPPKGAEGRSVNGAWDLGAGLPPMSRVAPAEGPICRPKGLRRRERKAPLRGGVLAAGQAGR